MLAFSTVLYALCAMQRKTTRVRLCLRFFSTVHRWNMTTNVIWFDIRKPPHRKLPECMHSNRKLRLRFSLSRFLNTVRDSGVEIFDKQNKQRSFVTSTKNHSTSANLVRLCSTIKPDDLKPVVAQSNTQQKK